MMSMQRKRQLYIAGGAALAVLIAAVVLIIALGGRGGSAEPAGSYQRFYDAAEAAYNRHDYGEALEALEQALEIEETEQAYLLMADIYTAKGDADHARRVLLTGYANVGGSRLEAELDRLNGSPSETQEPVRSVTVAGRTFPADTSSIVLSNRGLQNSDLETLSMLTALENLSVSGNAISDVTPLAKLVKLTSLQLSDNNIQDISALAELEELKTLYLDGNPVDDLTPLYELKNLRTLSMKSVSVTDKELSALEDALPSCYIFSDTLEVEPPEQLTLGGKTFYSDVTELDLGGLGITDISVLRQCPQLSRLDLRDNQISDLSPLSELAELEKLNLWNNLVQNLSPLEDLPRLQSLDLDGNRVGDLEALRNMPMLEELWLNNNTLRSLEPLEDLKLLRRLGLKHTKLTDADLEALFGMTNLTELALEDNDLLTAEGLEKLIEALPGCNISHSELLWTVELGGRSFTSDASEINARAMGITDLSGLEHFEALEALDLRDNDVTDLSPLYGLPALRSVLLSGNPRLSPEAVETLREHLPNCEIEAEEPEEPESDDGALNAVGAQAAAEAAESGTAFAILWNGQSATGGPIRDGILGAALDRGLDVVYDVSYPAGTEDFSDYLTAIGEAGADTVFLVMDGYERSLVLAQAKLLGDSVDFRHVQ